MQWNRFVIVLLAAVGLAACGNGEKGSTNAAGTPLPSAMEGKIVVGMSQCTVDEPWRVQMNADIEASAAMHPEIELIMKVAQDDALIQRGHIEEFVNQAVDVILCSPKEAAPLTAPLKAAYDAGIPVIVLDRAVLGDSYTQYISPDNLAIGEAVGRWAVDALGGVGRVVELKGSMTSTPGQDRHNGFRAGIEGSAIEVVFEADTDWKEANARSEMESALARFDAIDLVYAHNDPGAHGAYLAAKAAGREKEMRFVGVDALAHEGQRYVRDGVLDACFEYPTGGSQAIAAALKVAAGEEVPKTVVLPSRFFTPENIEGGGEWLNTPAAE